MSNTAVATLVTGWGQTEAHAEPLACELDNYYDALSVWTYRDAKDNPFRLAEAIDGRDVVSVSAGAEAVYEAMHKYKVQPTEIVAYSPPLRSEWDHLRPVELMLKTVVKTAAMHTPTRGIRSLDDIKRVLDYDKEATPELLREWAHSGRLYKELGQISSFNFVDFAAIMQIDNMPVTLVRASRDVYFQWTPDQLRHTRAMGVKILDLVGEHDEVMLRPERVIPATLPKAIESLSQSPEQAARPGRLGLSLRLLDPRPATQ